MARGDVVYRVYGVHSGRADDMNFGTFRTRAEAEAEIAKLVATEMHGKNWAAQVHDQGSSSARPAHWQRIDESADDE